MPVLWFVFLGNNVVLHAADITEPGPFMRLLIFSRQSRLSDWESILGAFEPARE